MEEVTWIEVLSPKRDVVSRQRIVARTVAIGRAYDNDIVVDDPYMAAQHIQLVRDDKGIWFVEDLGTINGIIVDGIRHRRVELDDDTIVQIGHTGVRVRTSAYVVAAEMPVVRVRSRWPAAVMALALVCLLAWLHRWLGETGEPKPIDYLGMLLVCVIVAMAWAAVWSMLSRIFTGAARYSLHLLVFGIGLGLFALYLLLSEIAAFALSWTALATSAYIVGWVVLAAVCFAHLRALSSTQWRLKAISVLALAVLGITMQNLLRSEDPTSSSQGVTLRQLEPPALRIVHAQSEAVFFVRAARLRITLDEARVRASVGGANGNGD